MTPTVVTINKAIQDAQQRLHEAGADTRLEAEILLAHVLECSRTTLRTWPERHITSEQMISFQQLIERRSQGEPVAYLIGQRDFWDMTLQVSANTLIPRPETELLVETALEKIPPDAQWHIADLGTGSGAIALAIAKERPGCLITATDISADALAVARTNAHQLNLHNVRFVEGHWFEPIEKERFEMIVSNPPYVHPADPHLQQGDLRFEPEQALASKPDGMMDIRVISQEAREHLLSPGWLILEHGYDQGSKVAERLTEMGFQEVSILNDLSQNERVCVGKWDSASDSAKI